MSIHTNVKGVDDFGKKQIDGETYQFEQHAVYKVNDLVLYFYPDNKMLGVYQVRQILEDYYKDGFTYQRGYMERIGRDINEIINRLKIEQPALSTALYNKVVELMKTYIK